MDCLLSDTKQHFFTGMYRTILGSASWKIFVKVRHNSAVLDIFTELGNVMNKIGESDARLWELLIRLFSIEWGTASESTVIGLPELTWSSAFLEPKFLKLSGYYTVVNSVFFFAQQVFLVASLMLWTKSNW